MAKNLSARLEGLAQGVLGPLILGGLMRPVAPIGAELALELGVGRRISDDDLRGRVDVARVRQARLLAPIDTLPDISPAEWALVAALNDLLQSANHELSGPFTRGRHSTLLSSTERLLSAIGRPRTTLEAIVRHTTFARILELERTDQHVRAWAGSITYRGQEPERSMTFWPSLRRVSIEPRKVSLHELPDGLDAVPRDRYDQLLSRLLSLTPITDVATLYRPAPVFHWSQSTLELIAYPIGRVLALRALSRAPAQDVVAGAKAATNALSASSQPHAIAESFCTDLLDRAS